LVGDLVTTEADVFATCRAGGGTADECARLVASQRVAGVYCDGTIVVRAGEAPRCVPRAVVERKLAMSRAPVATPPAASNGRGRILVWGAGAALLCVVLWAARG